MHGHERALGALAGLVDHLGEKFLAGPGLAEEQHRGVGRRHRANLLDRPLQRGGGTDHLAERKLPVEPGLQDRDLLLRRPRFQPAGQQQLDLPEIDRLLQEPIGAAAHRLHRRIHVAVGGHHDADRLLRELERALEDGHAILARHPQVGEHRVGRHILHQPRRLHGVLRDEALILILERRAQPLAGMLLVVDDEDRGLHGWPPSVWGRWVAPQVRAAFSANARRAVSTSARRARKLAFATPARSSRSER